MKRKILLVKPPEKSMLNFGAFSLGVLAAAVRQQANVSILDATNLSVPAAASAVVSERPHLVGITAMGLVSVPSVAAFVRCLREPLRSGIAGEAITIVVGGHGASMSPESLLSSGADGVVVGEGEVTFQCILEEGIRPGMAGVVCLNGGRIVSGPMREAIYPLDNLDPPARDLMPSPSDGVHLMETSRGCPHACGFCEATRFQGQIWRAHTPERVARELQRLVQHYDAWMVHFADDNFAANADRVLGICDRLQHGPLPLLISASARGDDIMADPRLVPAMAASHILRITVGVETAEPVLAAAAGKPVALDCYREAFERMRHHGMFSIASFIVGLPGETVEMRERAVQLAVDIGPDSARFLPFLALPGTPMAVDRNSPNPYPTDVRDAQRFTQAFFENRQVQTRLAGAAAEGGVRGLLARATLKRITQSASVK